MLVIPPRVPVIIRTTLRTLTVWLFVATSSTYGADTATSLCDISRTALQEASSIRGLVTKQDVPCAVQDKPQVEAFLHETIAVELPPQKLQMEEIAYKAIGLIPESFEYSKELVAFLVSQIGGYYDPKRKQFVMAAWLPATVQRGVAVHELTHALQDQHFNLRSLLNLKSGTTDTDIAISALIEGDASAVMFDSERRVLGERALKDTPSVDSLVLMQVLGANVGAQSGEVPDSLKSLLIFPYTSGLRFAHALLRAGGYERITQAYVRLPNSSREVLHPEDYLAGTFTPRSPLPSELPGATSAYQPEYSDVIGEFGIASLFTGSPATKPNAAASARGWIGDRVGLFPLKDSKREVSWLTRWESDAEAAEFFKAYSAFVEERYATKLTKGIKDLSSTKSIQIAQHNNSVTIRLWTTPPVTATAPPH